MTSRQKGNYLERLTVKWWKEHANCEIENASATIKEFPDKKNPGKTIKISAKHDFFNKWDHIIVLKEDFAPVPLVYMDSGNPMPVIWEGSTVYVQTKWDKQYGKDKAKYADFPAQYKYIFVWEKVKNRYTLTIQEL